MLVPTELFWAYLVAISLLTVTPGVDTLLVMRNAGRGGLKHGLRDAVSPAWGICCGLFIHATLSALGIFGAAGRDGLGVYRGQMGRCLLPDLAGAEFVGSGHGPGPRKRR